jgi:hypothetical protein
MVIVLGPFVSPVRALRLRLRCGRGSGRRLRPAGALVLTNGSHLGGALHHLPVADVLVAVHVGAVARSVVLSVVQVCTCVHTYSTPYKTTGRSRKNTLGATVPGWQQ